MKFIKQPSFILLSLCLFFFSCVSQEKIVSVEGEEISTEGENPTDDSNDENTTIVNSNDDSNDDLDKDSKDEVVDNRLIKQLAIGNENCFLDNLNDVK